MGGEDIQDQLPGNQEFPGEGLASEEERGSEYTAGKENKPPRKRGYVAEAMPDIARRVRDARGRYLTSALFQETKRPDSPYEPIYTLAEFPKHNRICARQLYMEANDPTEYAAALSILGSWEHWQHLCAAPWFAPVVEQWRAELKQKLLFEATKKVIDLCDSYESSSSLAAAKKLMDTLAPKPKSAPRRNRTASDEQSPETHTNPVGRPHKPPVLNEVSPEDTDADLARILEFG
jgi:hypothetical protein